MIPKQVPLSDIKNARKVRKVRSDLKKNLKNGKISISEAFSDISFYNNIKDMKVIDIVSSLPKTGRVSAVNILDELKISPCKKINGLGSQQKKNFCRYFGLTNSLIIKL